MQQAIWRFLSQILSNRNDLIDVIKPFMQNLRNDNINDEKCISLLESFPEDQLECLCKNNIINENKFNFLTSSHFNQNSNKNQIEEIISGDKITELQELIQKIKKKDVMTFKITKSFKEVKEIKIPVIQYCIFNNSLECFKYLLINGYGDPYKTMEEQNPKRIDIHSKAIKRYEWDCMATAIYYGNKEIMKILEEKGIEKGNNFVHIEAAILSYRNEIVEEIIEEMNEKIEDIQNFINNSIITALKIQNIKAFELLQGANINFKDIYYRHLIKNIL